MSSRLLDELLDVDSLTSALKSNQPHIPLFKGVISKANQVLEEYLLAGRSATELVPARAKFIDLLLYHIWQLFLPFDTNDISLVAVGGYGRGELHPASDIDLLIIIRDDGEKYKEGITAFLTFLWDIGLEVGHSVRNLEECVTEATGDITIATNIQESRLLFGSTELFSQQRSACAADKIWSGPDFFKAKLAEQIQRHHKYHDTAYNLEPNIKESPGGLRDIQMIGWVAKRHFNAETLHELVEHEFLTEDEYQLLHECQAFLWQIRFALHIIAKRREDRLLFDHQRTIAKIFGYQDKPGKLAVEQFMKQYYRTVMELSRLNEMLLQLFQEEILYKSEMSNPVAINKRFQTIKGYLEITHEKTFASYPFALLEIFLLLEQHPEIKGVRANTVRSIREHRHLIDNDFINDIRSRSLFMEIMRQTSGVTHELRRMNNYGILAAYLPVFENIVGQMQHDLYHVYTVDEHTLRLIRNLRRYTVTEYRHEFPLCSNIMQQIPKQELLLITGLFHDIAKGRGGDHSTLGAIDARLFCQQHDLSEYDTQLVTWLIENHLLMSSTAQRKDISDPDVVQEFAEHVGNENRLNYIYLLTVSDIRATSDKVWNSWKDSLLKELYYATQEIFRRGVHNPQLQSEQIADTHDQALKKIEKENYSSQEIEILWQHLGREYFLRYHPDEIIWHTNNILTHQQKDKPLILIRNVAKRGVTEVFIYTKTFGTLFHNATAAMEQKGINVLDARIFESTDGYSLDTFLVTNIDGHAFGDTPFAEDLAGHIEKQLSSHQPIEKLSRQLPRQAKHFQFPTTVRFDQDKINHRTIVFVKAYDRPGLLSRISLALNQCNIQLSNVIIATYGERVEDYFYITDQDDQPIKDSVELKKLEETIKANLES